MVKLNSIKRFAASTTLIALSIAMAGIPLADAAILRGAISVTLNSTPVSQMVTSGTDEVEVVSFKIDGNPVFDTEVTSIVMSAYLDEDRDGTFYLGSDNGYYLSDLLNSVTLYDSKGSAISKPTTVDGSGNINFSGMSLIVASGETEIITVVADISNTGTLNGDDDIFSIDITDVYNSVEAYSPSGKQVRVKFLNNSNGATSPNVAVTVTNAGKIIIEESDDPVGDQIAIAGNDSSDEPLLVARYDVYANSEEFLIEELILENDDFIDQVIIKYPTSTSDPNIIDGEATTILISGEATFTGIEIAVPESATDENKVSIEVYVTTNEVDANLPTGGQIELDLREDGISAIGQTSGDVVGMSGLADVDSNETALYKSLPIFETDDSETLCSSTLVVGAESNVYCFTVTADSEGGDIGLYQLTFDAEEVLLETGKTPRELNWTWYIYEHDGAGTIIGPTLGDGTWDPDTGKVTITFSTEVAILSGDTMNLVLTAPVSFTSSVDTSSLTMRLANDVEFEPVAAASAVERGIVWNDRSNSSHSFDTDDWTNSYTLDYLPADYFTATE